MEALDPEKNPEARAMLQGIVSAVSASERVREAAVESLMQSFPTEEQASWLAQQMFKEQSGPGAASSRRVHLAMLNSLEERGSRGIQFVIEALRSSKDREIRKRALEILAESDDPRAKKELARILEP